MTPRIREYAIFVFGFCSRLEVGSRIGMSMGRTWTRLSICHATESRPGWGLVCWNPQVGYDIKQRLPAGMKGRITTPSRNFHCRLRVTMCFRTEVNDPTQQPVRISQSAESPESVMQGSGSQGRNTSDKKEQSRAHGDISGHYQMKKASADNAMDTTPKSGTVRSERGDKAKRRGTSGSMMGFGADFGASPV